MAVVGCIELTLINDRYGLRPVYWVRLPQGFAYAGKVKALLSIPDVGKKIDQRATEEWFSIGYLLGERTWIEDIQLLPAGTVLRVDQV